MRKPSASPALRQKSSRSSLGGGGGGGGGPEEQERQATPKRSISNLITGLREAQGRMESIEEPIPLTAAQLATAHFTRELLGHGDADLQSDVVVILHDACYGHRWSRLKTSKGQLSLIVERPERIHASVLGASTAYVRLGGHHAGAKHAPHPDRNPDAQPPFKIRRTARTIDLTSAYVTAVHGTQWMTELQGMCHAAQERLAAGIKEVSRDSDKTQLHPGDLYLAPASLDAFQGALGGVADAVDAVFTPGSTTSKSFVAVRPPGHHCSADHPSGFCWLNNVHVGIEYAAQSYGMTHAAIFDFDLHHGDGSQAIAWERNSKNNEKRQNAKANSKLKLSPDIGYYSLHDINSYPCEYGDDAKVQAASLCVENAHSQSIWNVHLQPWKTEDDFWKLYEDRYRILLDKARVFLTYHTDRVRTEGRVLPKAAIFISAGFDASEWEGEGMQRHKVNVPTEFYARFTEDIVKLSREVSGCDGRVISVLEGGYSDRALCSGVLSHLSGLCATSVTTESDDGLDHLMSLSNKMNGLSMTGVNSHLRYDKSWWSSANLTALEHKINPPPPPQVKKHRVGPQPTYATPTESFAYKVVDTNKFARSISGTLRDVPRPERAPTPPLPEVDWVVATQELSHLLIPHDRQTKSCTADELVMPRTKKDAMPPPPPHDASQPRQLRDRRAKTPAYAESAYSDESSRSISRNESRASRRETIDILPSRDVAALQQRRLSRRLSAGSASSITNSDAGKDRPPMPSVPGVTNGNVNVNGSMNGSMKPPPIPAPSAQVGTKKVRAPVKAARTAAATAPSSPAGKTSSAPRPPATGSVASEQSSDVDSLTSGLRKITLKAPASKEEHDRKQMEKLNAERRARALKGAETRRVNAAAKKAAQSASATANASTTITPSPAHDQGTLTTALPAGTTAASTRPGVAVSEAATWQNVAQPEEPFHITSKENVAPLQPFEAMSGADPTSLMEIEPSAASAVAGSDSSHGSSQLPVPQAEPYVSGTPLEQTRDLNTQPNGAEEPPMSTVVASPPLPPAKMSADQSLVRVPPSQPSRPSQLPVFSSTGHIPFAKASITPPGEQEMKGA